MPADACGVVFPMEEGVAVGVSLCWVCVGGRVHFFSSSFEDGSQGFWVITSVEEMLEEG